MYLPNVQLALTRSLGNTIQCSLFYSRALSLLSRSLVYPMRLFPALIEMYLRPTQDLGEGRGLIRWYHLPVTRIVYLTIGSGKSNPLELVI